MNNKFYYRLRAIDINSMHPSSLFNGGNFVCLHLIIYKDKAWRDRTIYIIRNYYIKSKFHKHYVDLSYE